jgi:hypothetical protein
MRFNLAYCRAVERAALLHLPFNALHRTGPDLQVFSDGQRPLLGSQLNLYSLLDGGVDLGLPSCLPASTALFSPARTR